MEEQLKTRLTRIFDANVETPPLSSKMWSISFRSKDNAQEQPQVQVCLSVKTQVSPITKGNNKKNNTLLVAPFFPILLGFQAQTDGQIRRLLNHLPRKENKILIFGRLWRRLPISRLFQFPTGAGNSLIFRKGFNG